MPFGGAGRFSLCGIRVPAVITNMLSFTCQMDEGERGFWCVRGVYRAVSGAIILEVVIVNLNQSSAGNALVVKLSP